MGMVSDDHAAALSLREVSQLRKGPGGKQHRAAHSVLVDRTDDGIRGFPPAIQEPCHSLPAEQGLIPRKTFDSAANIINSTLDFEEFFWYPVCCKEEEEDHGCS
jgi:hypothetical protein